MYTVLQEETRLDRREFIEKICTIGKDCMILDDDLINPNEIIVLTKKRKVFLKEREALSVVTENGRKRYVRIVSYKEAGLVSWEKGLKANGTKLGASVVMLHEKDCAAVFLYYVFVHAQTKNWLYHNILHVLKARLEVANEEDLLGWLAEYVKRNNYKVEVKYIVKVSHVLLEHLSSVAKICMDLNQLRLKVIRKLSLKRVVVNVRIHRYRTKKKYFKYLEEHLVVGSEWSEIDVKGASASAFVKDIQGANTYFIKGNEMSNYRGITNEILAQKKLFEYSEDRTWFLNMRDYDYTYKWIRYDYVTWPLLNQYVEENGLTEQERILLGDYLVMVLDYLYSMNIVHNDMRRENIMVRTKNDGSLDGFILIDFGCASCDGSVPWNRGSFLGRYLDRNGCGEMRYNEVIVDDAASALLVYLSVGGNPEDENARKIRERIGRLYFLCKD